MVELDPSRVQPDPSKKLRMGTPTGSLTQGQGGSEVQSRFPFGAAVLGQLIRQMYKNMDNLGFKSGEEFKVWPDAKCICAGEIARRGRKGRKGDTRDERFNSKH